MLDRLLPLDHSWFWFAVDAGIKATLLLALAAGATLLLRRTSAALRDRVWALTFAALLILPLASMLLPGWSWKIIPPDWQASATALRQLASSDTAVIATDEAAVSHSNRTMPLDAAIQALAETEDRPAIQPPALHSPTTDNGPLVTDNPLASPTRPNWILLLWLAGAVAVLLPLACGVVANWRLKRGGRQLLDQAWLDELDEAGDQLNLSREVALLVGGPEQMPMTFGWLHSYVVLPSDAPNWPAEQRRMVLLHELAHVKRCDVAWQMVARFGCALYWFHPLVWHAVRRMRLEREHACDDCALVAGQKASNYASQLLEIARAHRTCSPLASAALSMARPSQLEGRLLAVLDAHRSRAALSTPRAVGLLVAAMLLVICLGMLRPAVQADTPVPATADTATTASSKTDGKHTVISGKVLSPEGKPLSGASVEVIAYERRHFRPNLPGHDRVDHQTTTTDKSGDFRIVFPRDDFLSRKQTSIFASAPGYALTQENFVGEQGLQPLSGEIKIDLKLNERKTVRVRLLDAVGSPVVGVTPQMRSCDLESEKYIGIMPSHARSIVSAWPQAGATDSDGYAKLDIPATTKTVDLIVEDERVGIQFFQNLPVEDGTITAALKPARFLKGRVVAANDGAAIEGATVAVVEEPFHPVRSGADGSFRLPRGSTIGTLFQVGQSILHIYPPSNSPYLFQAREWNWPKDGIGDAELTIKLVKGIVVEGDVVEKGSNKPVAGATIYFEPQIENNKSVPSTARSRWAGSDMKYETNEKGHFRLPVWPGPGYLLVKAPTLDYLHVTITDGDRWYGKPGMIRLYFDGAVHTDFRRDDAVAPVKIELERGVTLRRKVVRPDGQPAIGKAYARSYLQGQEDINQHLPEIPIDNGTLELAGYEPERSNPLFILDLEHHCGATVSPTKTEVTFNTPPLQLQPCGAANFRFVTDKGDALANYQPWLHMIVTQGAPPTHYYQPNEPVWADIINWHNLAYWHYPQPSTEAPKTDTDGRVTIPDLIPGATYRVSFVNKNGNPDEGYEFTARSGETIEVGDVVIPKHD